jgi:5'-3' exonuclease
MKINLIIDGNYLLFKDVFILKKMNCLKKELIYRLINDFKKISKSFPFDNIYFVSDSKYGNWRKEYYKEYKGERKKDQTIDWDFVFKTYDEFKIKLQKQKNIKFLELSGLEGDDFIAHIVRKSNDKGYSNLIVSSDGDLQQLLKYNLNEKWLNIQWNYKFNDQRLYLPQNYQLVIEKLSTVINENVFELDNSAEFIQYIEDLINKTKTITVSYDEILLKKIVWGDKGDNIPSCCKVFQGKINVEGRGIGKSGAATICKLYKEMYPEIIDLNSDIFISNLVDIIIYYKKIKDITAKDKITEQLKFNRKLIFLMPKYMPKLVYTEMDNYFNNIENRIIEYENIDLEDKLEEDNFFDEPVQIIPEQFTMEKSDDNDFDPDVFWEL